MKEDKCRKCAHCHEGMPGRWGCVLYGCLLDADILKNWNCPHYEEVKEQVKRNQLGVSQRKEKRTDYFVNSPEAIKAMQAQERDCSYGCMNAVMNLLDEHNIGMMIKPIKDEGYSLTFWDGGEHREVYLIQPIELVCKGIPMGRHIKRKLEEFILLKNSRS